MPRNSIVFLDTSKLEIGKWYTYKELCEELREEYKKNSSTRKTQLEEFSRFFKWTYNKCSKKYKVIQIYDQHKDEIYKYSSKSIYTKYIECLLLKNLMYREGNDITYPLKPLYSELGAINNTFNIYYNNRDALLVNIQNNKEYQDKSVEINEYDINYVYNQCYNKLKEILESALDSLQKRKKIKWEKVDEVLYYDKESENQLVKIANKDERSLLLKVEHKVLKELQCKDEEDIFKKGKEKEYYKLCNEYLLEEGNLSNIKLLRYWQSYHIIYNNEILPEALDNTEIELNQMCLNAELVNYFHNKTDNIITSKYLEKRVSDCLVDIWLQDDDVNKAIDNQILDLKELYKKLYNTLIEIPGSRETLKKEQINERRREIYQVKKEKDKNKEKENNINIE